MATSRDDRFNVTNTSRNQSLGIFPETIDARRSRHGPGTVTSTHVTDNGQELLNTMFFTDDGPQAHRGLSIGDRAGPDFDNMGVTGVGGSIPLDPAPQMTDGQLFVEPGGKTIKQLLWAARKPEKGGKLTRIFIPRGQLDSICNFDAVCSEVRRHVRSDEDAARCAEYVCGPRAKPRYKNSESLRKIFAILVLLNQTQLVFEFQKAGIKDKHLPLRKDDDETTLLSTHADMEENVHLDFFMEMSDPWVVAEFYDKQWSVYVPFITRDPDQDKAKDYKLDAKTIMPWTDYPTKVDAGGYGDVRRIEIHPEHHGFSEKYQAFALKTIRQVDGPGKVDFEREIKAFRKMPAVKHLVELCATFELEGEYQLLFPWADGGSLKNLWKSLPTSLFGFTADIESNVFMHWLATQACGLMSGLSTIHELPQPRPNEVADNKLYGIHGDLKPENILHFSQETEEHSFGRLKIADFGIVEFRSLATRTSPNQEYTGPASPTYRSPEHDIGIQQKRSRKVDIWSMGCVFSELLTWARHGGDAVESYRECRLAEPTRLGESSGWKEDNFFCRAKGIVYGERGSRRQYDRHIVKPSVDKWLDNLAHRSSNPGGSPERTFFNEFLTFIRTKMLNPSRMDRATCEEVSNFINQELSLNPLNDSPSYWTCQWEHQPPRSDNIDMGNSQVHLGEHAVEW